MPPPQSKRSWARFVFVYLPLSIYVLSVVYGIERLSVAKSTETKEDRSDVPYKVPQNHQEITKGHIPLPSLTQGSEASKLSEIACKEKSLVWIDNIESAHTKARSSNTGIPHIVHQTSRTRCLTNDFAQLTRRWKEWGESNDWSYYFHDDEAIQRLIFEHEVSSEFPNLHPIFQHCLLHGTARADVWRYLVLYLYGGIYADLDTVPDLLTADMFRLPHYTYDALFVLEQYHMLSQYFMAVTPRHPLMWYALQHSLLNVAKATDTGLLAAAMTTGPHALHQAYQSFRADVGDFVEPAGPGRKPVWAGTFSGTNNRTVTVMGIAEDQNEYVNRDALGNTKRRNYKKMGMTFHQDDRKHASGESCLHALLQFHGGIG